MTRNLERGRAGHDVPDGPEAAATGRGGAPEPPAPERGGLLQQRFKRRHVLLGAGAAVVLAGAGTGISEWVSPTPPAPEDVDRFRSRPDLEPFRTTVEVPADGVAPGYVFVTSGAGPGQRGPMIVDDAGQLVWFRQSLPVGAAATNLKVQQYRGQPVLTWWEGDVILPQGYGKGEYVVADTSYREITRVTAAHGHHGDLHELVLTPAGTALFTVYRAVPFDLRPIGGPRHGKLLDSMVQEVDVATGSLRFEWDARDHLALAESYLSPATIARNGGEYDFAHLNSIDVDTDGNLLISARNTWAVYKVDRSSGDIVWRLNGKRSDFQVPERARFEYQHDATRAPDGALTLFDDGGGPPNVASRSRGLALGVDEVRRTVTLLEEYLPDPATLATSQGSVQSLPNGNRFVGWGSKPYASEYTRDGALLFDLSYPSGALSYRAYRYEWTGKPSGHPAIAVAPAGPGRVSVAASWNGATEVRAWRVLAGRTSRSLEPVTTVARTGFETTATVAVTRPVVAVAALDANGNVLGTSETLEP